MIEREPENHVIARAQQDLPSALAKFYAHYVCLDAVSCDVRGELTLDNHISQPCTEPDCVTLKTLHTVFLYARSTRCNAVDLGAGTLQLYNLVTAFQRDGNGRGVHRGNFVWESPGIGTRSLVYGDVVGVTNVGTHREPPFPPCQSGCDQQGVLEGQLYNGVFEVYSSPGYRGATLSAAYRIAFTPTPDGGAGSLEGTVEGAVLADCKDDVP